MKGVRLLCGVLVMSLLGGFAGAAVYAQVFATSTHLPGSDYFTDVSADSPHSEDIGFAREAGITMGMTPELYGPKVEISREQMASFQMRDFAAAMALAIEISREMHGSSWGESPNTNMTIKERAELLRWGADLLSYEDPTRPEGTIGGVTLYPHLISELHEWADMLDPPIPIE